MSEIMSHLITVSSIQRETVCCDLKVQNPTLPGSVADQIRNGHCPGRSISQPGLHPYVPPQFPKLLHNVFITVVVPSNPHVVSCRTHLRYVSKSCWSARAALHLRTTPGNLRCTTIALLILPTTAPRWSVDGTTPDPNGFHELLSPNPRRPTSSTEPIAPSRDSCCLV